MLSVEKGSFSMKNEFIGPDFSELSIQEFRATAFEYLLKTDKGIRPFETEIWKPNDYWTEFEITSVGPELKDYQTYPELFILSPDFSCT